jgi:hypothetical protein
VSRPNILMFGDWSWLPERTHAQEQCFQAFLEQHADARIAVIELGAGSAIPTIRATSERIGWRYRGATVIRTIPVSRRSPHPISGWPAVRWRGCSGLLLRCEPPAG